MKYSGKGLRIRLMEVFATHPLWVYWGEQVWVGQVESVGEGIQGS